MAKKKPTKKKDDNTSEPLQAVILANHESINFSPLIHETPKFLLPIANVPAIDYTLEMLFHANVSEVIFIADSFTNRALDSYLSSSQWKNTIFDIQFIDMENETSTPCDALRRLEQMQIINSNPFILISSVVASNMDLKPVLEGHKKLNKKDKRNLMTCVMKEYSKGHHHYNNNLDRFVLVSTTVTECNGISSDFKRILKYLPDESLQGINLSSQDLTKREIEISDSFCDAFIDICSPSVLNLAVDNFDFSLLRKHLLKGALESELEGLKAFLYCPENCYLGVIRSFEGLKVVTNDIINNWCFPITPSNNFFQGNYEDRKGERIYLHPTAKISSSSVSDNILLGENSELGPFSKISKSSIGPNCVIKTEAIIDNCILRGDCSIGTKATLSNCILGRNVIIGDNSVIPEGIIISDGTQLCSSDFDDIKSFSVINNKGENTARIDIKNEPKGPVETAESLSNDENDSKYEEEIYSSPSNSEIEEKTSDKNEDKNKRFINEIKHILISAENVGNSVEMTNIELTSFKLSMELESSEVYFKGILSSLFELSDPSRNINGAVDRLYSVKKSSIDKFNQLVIKWKVLFKAFISNEEDQLLLLSVLETVSLIEDRNFMPYFPHCLSVFYDCDLIEEDVVVIWWGRRREELEGVIGSEVVYNACDVFIDWLKEGYDESYDE